MSAPLIVICPICATANRVPAEKLGGSGKCGRCSAPLFAGKPLDITAGNFEKHAVTSDIPIIIDFWAAWCGPCRQMAPAFEAAARELEPQFRLGKIDTEAEQALAGRFNIRGIPCLIMFSKGREVARNAGAMPKDAIIQWARQSLSSI